MTRTFKRKYLRLLPQMAALTSGSLLLFFGGCGSATPNGMCKEGSSTGYVAGTTDVNGDKWEIRMPKDDTFKCASNTETGQVTIQAVVVDSQQIPKAGLAVLVSGAVVCDKENSYPFCINSASSTFTDTCGVAYAIINWKCPESAGAQREARISVSSGALTGSTQLTIDHYTPPTALAP